MAPVTDGIDGLLGQMSNLDINTRSQSSADRVAAIEDLIESVKKSIEIAGNVQAFKTQDVRALASLDDARLRSLHLQVSRLAETSHIIQSALSEVRDLAARSVVQSLVDLAQRDVTINALLKHFDPKITLIARNNIENSNSGRGQILVKTAEECYNATQSTGQLDADDYFALLDAAALQWPMDPDFESKEGCRQCWPHFWLNVLSKCPGGPTLFAKSVWPLGYMPRYLFRVFDQNSSGSSDKDKIASQASVEEAAYHRIDLLSLDRDEATDMLFRHLKWISDKDCIPINLTSWTSSLLYAIQYAVYRCHKYQLDNTKVKICVVDTTKFPRGQFARDSQLINAFMRYDSATGAEEFFRFRLRDKRYHNGEYLSQGLVSLPGQSCVVSLGRLERSGLFDLYPEFDDEQRRMRWANRVLELRTSWSTESLTSEEAQTASAVAKRCFPAGFAKEMTTMLLCFKNWVPESYEGIAAGYPVVLLVETQGGPILWAGEAPDEFGPWVRIRMEGRRRVQGGIQTWVVSGARIDVDIYQAQPEKKEITVWTLFIRAESLSALLVGGVLQAGNGENLLETKAKEVLDGTVLDFGIEANPVIAPYNIMAGNFIKN
ncbi:hypothetical protein VPNG_09276 [Cytospora leucostoma]|uniref:DUF7587 domain-containing protein n=1 Tax=Cytospora leucostoma TaxID=1230097 RepID=A0A423W0K6_9PEZI|nr:hypothetical protein VPNG_09276 [Cytospora leucostoma]